MSAIDFVARADGGFRVVVDGRAVGELVLWPHTRTWRFVDLSRAHWNVGKTLDEAKAFVIANRKDWNL